MTQKFTRRYFLRLALGSSVTVGLSAAGGVGYSTLVEPSWLALERVEVPITGLPAHLDGFTIVQLSDLHRGETITEEQIAHAVDLARRQQADLAVLTGDYVSGSAGYASSCAEALEALVTSGDVLACLGNHDHWTRAEDVTEALVDAGVRVLRNAACEIADGLWIAGVDDVWEEKADLEKALEKVPAGATTVLLAHEPDYANLVAADGRVSLQLSGHSHGGQVRLPIFGPPVLPYLAHEYPRGHYQVGMMQLYVNRGVGLVNPAVRLNCRPEVTLLTLRHPPT